jgi:hypothetical protein
MLEVSSMDGCVGEPVEPWDAWWNRAVIADAPSPNCDPPLQASPELQNHLVDILYSYCYVMRTFNGEVLFDMIEACETLLAISRVLGSKCRIPSIESALRECLEATKREDLFVEYQWQVEVVHDVELCLQSKSHVFRCLSEAIAITSEGKAKSACMKLQFFFAWSQTLSMDQLEQIKSEVHDYYTSLHALLADVYSVEAMCNG